MPNTLNVSHSQRLSVVLVYLLGVGLLASLWWPEAALGAVVLASIVTVVNRDFYRYMAARRGRRFALRVVPLHWLYFAYCGGCMAWGTGLHYVSRNGDKAPQAFGTVHTDRGESMGNRGL
jgi:hypothetical protein